MDEYKSIIPGSKDFFKISELAGKRWPNVTEDQIYEWHDAELRIPLSSLGSSFGYFKETIKKFWPETELPDHVIVAIEDCWFEIGQIDSMIDVLKELWPDGVMPDSAIQSIRKEWPDTYPTSNNIPGAVAAFFSDNVGAIHENVNLVTYWVFFPKFISVLPPPEDDQVQGADSGLDSRKRKISELFPYKTLERCCFRLSEDEVKGFSLDKDGKADCLVFFDEEGNLHFPGVFDQEAQKYFPGTVEIKKEDLLIRASSVRLLEIIVPEITNTNFGGKGEGFKISETGKSEVMLLNPPGSKILNTWGEIADYTEFSESTVKRRFKKVIRYTETGTVITTTAEIDKFRLATATKNKTKKT